MSNSFKVSLDIAEYFLKNEFKIVGVDKNSIGYASMILWNAPESWSAWQWDIIIFSIKLGGIPSLLNALELKGGGSIIIPLLFIQSINPDVDPQASKPCEEPNIVRPNTGGSNASILLVIPTLDNVL